MEALEFLFREIGVCGWQGRVERGVFVRVMYCSSLGLDAKSGVQSDLPLNGEWLILR